MLTACGHGRSLDQSAESIEEPRFGRVSRVVRDCFICFSLVGLAGAHAEVRDDHQARSATLLTASERANTSLSGHLQRSAIDRVRAHLNSQAVATLLC
jgi:hypothetical protein